MSDVQKAIQAMLKAIHTPPGAGPAIAHRRVVCISRDCGSGGDEAARLLAERLGLEVYDRVVLDRISKRLDAEPETMRAIDASSGQLRDLWLYSLMTGQDLSTDSYRRHLLNVIVSLGRSGGVILGRAAHLVLARSGALRVRIICSPEVAAKRVAAAEGLSADAAVKRVEEVNRGRAQFVWEQFHERLDDPRTFDLTINTDHMADVSKVVDLLVEAIDLVGEPAAGAASL